MSSMATSATLWLRSARWDAFWLLSGLWLLVPALLYSAFPEAIRLGFAGATLLLWLAHRFATAFTAYCIPSFRELVTLEWKRFILAPAVIFATVYAFLFLPEPWVEASAPERVLFLGTVFFVYNAYHFSVQHFGVLALYRIRAGTKVPGSTRRLEKAYCLLVTGVGVSLAQILHGAAIVGDTLAADALGALPLTAWLEAIRPVTIVAIPIAAGFVAKLDCLPARSLTPRRLYLASVAAQGIAAYFLAPTAFLLLWAVQHWLVSVGLGAHMAENELAHERPSSFWYRLWAPFNGRFWPSVLLLGAVSIVGTPLFELILHPERLGADSSWIGTLTANVVIGLAFGSVFTHFVLDRAVFRFGNPRVRHVTGRLIFGGTPS